MNNIESGVTKIAVERIESNRQKFYDLANSIWQTPEAGFHEYQSADFTAKLLRELGFKVELGTANVPTAIRAVWGSGHPVVGVLGEYDALPNLSQTVSTKKSPIAEKDYGHACGHNLIAAGHVAAAWGIKCALEESNLEGTVVFYGCPAEELGVGKGLMANGGAFYDLDFALAYHPFWSTYAFTGYKMGILFCEADFKGTTCHLGSVPYTGRNALNPVQLTSIAGAMIKEELPKKSKFITSIRDLSAKVGTGERAVLDIMMKGTCVSEINGINARIKKIAESMAEATETSLEYNITGGCFPLLNNDVLTAVVDGALNDVERPVYTADEMNFAKAINQTFPDAYQTRKKIFKTDVQEIMVDPLPVQNYDTDGSTDVGDVSYIVPTAFFKVATEPIAVKGHDWQTTACSGHTIGLKGMIYAAKVIAVAALRVFEDKTLLKNAKDEFDSVLDGYKYRSFVPEDYRIK